MGIAPLVPKDPCSPHLCPFGKAPVCPSPHEVKSGRSILAVPLSCPAVGCSGQHGFMDVPADGFSRQHRKSLVLS